MLLCYDSIELTKASVVLFDSRPLRSLTVFDRVSFKPEPNNQSGRTQMTPGVGGGGGGGYSQNSWVGVCGPLPKTLTLFMTKVCDFWCFSQKILLEGQSGP